jgi:hypothetical protein
MKTLQCDLCDETAQGETFEAWIQALLPHYLEVHADAMNENKKTQESRQKWFVENKKRFDAA